MKLKQQKGFTIIEVLIVLAIAGLILLIVFLAVPALQRNSRNTQRGNDASRVAAAINECLSNNNGDLSVCDDAAAIDPTYMEFNQNGQLVTAGGAGVDSLAITVATVCQDNAAVPGAARAFTITYLAETNNGGTTPRCVSS